MTIKLALKYCPCTLSELPAGISTYSKKGLAQLFSGRKVSHILPYDSPESTAESKLFFEQQQSRISISGVQEKTGLCLDADKLRFCNTGERSQYILKPVPTVSKNADQMPANEHLTMQIAAQIYGIETAPNALIFFQDGAPAYLTKRFDIADDNTKIAQEDFAVLAGKTPQTAGEDYKYSGCYLDLFVLMQQYVAAYAVEAAKLWTQLLFNYLFCNGDAHLKNFSLLQTKQGDYRLSPAYDLLNSRIHVEDADFALSGKLLPPQLAVGKIRQQFLTLAQEAQIATKLADKILQKMSIESAKLQQLIQHSYLSERIKRNYLQAYQTRLKLLNR